jgi:LmbE family N-acetylglucosaminyl deacetylase
MVLSAPQPGSGSAQDALPTVRQVLAVCAHPDDESFGLGAVLSAFAAMGTDTAVLSFTHGEASTLHVTDGELATVRAEEFARAADVLGVCARELLDYPDGGLASRPIEELAARVSRVAEALGTDLLLVFDVGGITGHPDHQRATDAALAAAAALDIPVLAWVVPDPVARRLNSGWRTSFVGRGEHEIDIRLSVDRRRQQEANACHRSQSASNPVLDRRLELQGDVEWLRWLRWPASRRIDLSE